MADVQISVSDELRIITGRYLNLDTDVTRKMSVPNDLYLKREGNVDSTIPTSSDNIPLLKTGNLQDSIDLPDGELVNLKVSLFRTDQLDLLIEDSSSVKVFISTSDTLEVIVIDSTEASKPFVQNNHEIWSFKKVNDKWQLDKYSKDWNFIAEKYDWLFNKEITNWKSTSENINWSFQTTSYHWKDKELPEIWVHKKRKDTWQK